MANTAGQIRLANLKDLLPLTFRWPPESATRATNTELCLKRFLVVAAGFSLRLPGHCSGTIFLFATRQSPIKGEET